MKVLDFIKKNLIFIIILLTILLTGRYVFSIGIASGESMLPTITSPSILLINKLPNEYERNEVVVCKTKGSNITKRVIGLPGETITVTADGLIFINNVQYEDKFGNITIPLLLEGNRTYPLTLASDEYFVMGDNRNVSKDSRHNEIGNIQKDSIIGVVLNY